MRKLFLSLCLLFAASAQADDLTTMGVTNSVRAAAHATVTVSYSTSLTGGGGYVTGIDINPQGDMLVRTDTYGGYVRQHGAAKWTQCVTSLSMPSADVVPYNNAGVYEIRWAPSVRGTAYMVWQGYTYKTTNYCATWTKLPLAQFSTDANNPTKFEGPFLAVDPANANIVYVSVPANGVVVSKDGGATWNAIPTTSIAIGGSYPGADEPGGNLIVFDPHSTVVGGVTQGIYITSYGTGLYHSVDGGVTWTLVANTPLDIIHFDVGSDGVVWVINSDTSSASALWIYSAGSWTNSNMGGSTNQGAQSVAVDPSDPTHVAVITIGGPFSATSTANTVWSGFGVVAYTGSDVPWLATVQQLNGYMDAAAVKFDPTQTNVVYATNGIGVWSASPASLPVANETDTWTDYSAGIENMVSTKVISPIGGPILKGTWDRPVWYGGLNLAYPAGYGPNYDHTIVAGWDMDWQGNNPSHIVGLFNFGSSAESSYSNQGGQYTSWTKFHTTPPPEVGGGSQNGSIAISNDGSILYIGVQAPLYCSSDNGVTWPQPSIAGQATSGDRGWFGQAYITRHIARGDKIAPATLYVYNSGSIAGLWRSDNGCAGPWYQAYAGHLAIGGEDAWNGTLDVSPTAQGDLFYTGGWQSPGPHPVSEPFMHSTDGGVTWNSVPGMEEILTFGFGAPAPGSTYSTVYAIGWYNNVYGVWYSIDDGATWRNAGAWPGNSIDQPNTIVGNNNRFGEFTVGFSGSSYITGELSNAATNPMLAFETVTGLTPNSATICWQTDIAGANSLQYGTTNAYGATVSASSGLSPCVTLTGLTNSTTYHYRVKTGLSQSYDLAFSTTNGIPPSAPTSVVATNLQVYENSLTWTNNQGSDPQPVSGVYIYRNGVLIATKGVVSSYNDLGATPNTTYTYTVASFDASGNVSPQSVASNSVTTGNGPGIVVTDQASSTQLTHDVAYSVTTTTNALNFGAAVAGRRVCAIVEASVYGTSTFSGVKENGLAMTEVATDGGAKPSLSIWCVPDSVNTSGIIEVDAPTYVTSILDVIAFTTLKASQGTNPAGIHFDYQATPLVQTPVIPTNGAALACVNFAPTATVTFSGGGFFPVINPLIDTPNASEVACAITYVSGSPTLAMSFTGNAGGTAAVTDVFTFTP